MCEWWEGVEREEYHLHANHNENHCKDGSTLSHELLLPPPHDVVYVQQVTGDDIVLLTELSLRTAAMAAQACAIHGTCRGGPERGGGEGRTKGKGED